MSATLVGVAPSRECLRSKSRYGSCGWQVKLCDPLANGPYLIALEILKDRSGLGVRTEVTKDRSDQGPMWPYTVLVRPVLLCECKH